jgi:hypothetical protein
VYNINTTKGEYMENQSGGMQQAPQAHEWKSISKSTQPHKFFERYLDNDLDNLANELMKRYEQIEQRKIDGITEVTNKDLWLSSNSVSTMKWREYNVFQFNIPEIYNLYTAVADMVREACEHYELDFDEEQFMIQGWFNINYTKKGKLDWHEHGGHGAPDFHGYYAVKAEPSITHYKVFDTEVENYNKNNRAILSEMGHPHAMADWDWDGPRITVAYDVTPLRYLMKYGSHHEQHWVPLQ